MRRSFRSSNLRTKYRSFYVTAVAVAGLGLVGSAFVPRAQSNMFAKPAVIELTYADDENLEQDGSFAKRLEVDSTAPLLGFAGLGALSLSGLLSLSSKRRA